MQEVKIREEEYDRVKDLSARISGIPANMRLANRERRLLMHGPARLTGGSTSGSETSLTDRRIPRMSADPGAYDDVQGVACIFTDLMLLASSHDSRKDTSWVLLKADGLSRVLGVEQLKDHIEGKSIAKHWTWM